MATAHKQVHRPRGRTVKPRRSAARLLALVLAVLLPIALITALLVQGWGSAEPLPVTVAGSTPPNAEANGRAWGPADAPIKIEEFVDYQCPACQEYATRIEPQVIAAFASTGKVRYEVHNFQFKGEDSLNAAEGGYCAAEQNAFWPFHSSLYASLPHNHVPGIFGDERLGLLATRLGLDRERFDECLAGDRYAQQVTADYQAAVRRNIQSTPTFIVNGQAYSGVQELADLQRIIAEVAPGVLP